MSDLFKDFNPLTELHGDVETPEEARKRTWGKTLLEIRQEEERHRAKRLNQSQAKSEKEAIRSSRKLAGGVKTKAKSETSFSRQLQKIRGF